MDALKAEPKPLYTRRTIDKLRSWGVFDAGTTYIRTLGFEGNAPIPPWDAAATDEVEAKPVKRKWWQRG